ncbi:amidase [Sphingosinicella sp. BN140058]|uniref:amidase n=1 Tax=Sphingosinicella sp. BN140058 TaxID=1892855 RepID=UPI001010F17E|nr:amidase [Sphingosinicella sp. BN140058]QAY76724.1 amidase [Sphingosinicella sp. BN140058]
MRQALLLSTVLAAAIPVTGAATAAAETPAFSSAARAEANTKAALQRIKKLNPKVNAVIAVDPTAIAQARALDRSRKSGSESGAANVAAAQPLFGMPVLLKDNIEASGPLPTTAGSLALKDNVTNRDAPLVARLRGAGAVIVGKTNLSEWANIRSNASISGWSAVGGQTRNPFALNRNPCGSSSGSGAAVAAGMVPAAIGTETDGSITCPAAINGIVGFKPTVGLVSRSRIVPISHSQDTAGPMTRSVRDAALVLTAIAGSDPTDPATAEADRHRGDFAAALSADSLRGKRIGVMRFASGFGTDAAFEEALATLKREGAVLVDIAKMEGRDEIGGNEFKVLLTELKADLNAYLATTPPSVRTRNLADVIAFNQANAATELALFGQETFVQAEATKGLDDPEYRKARATSFRLAGPEGIDKLLRDNDLVALVGPTMPASWPIDAVHGDQISGGGAGGLAAVAGYPHLTVPMGQVKGLPVGLSFIGAKWSDATILSLGYDYEQASHKIMTPRLLPSIEESPEIAPHLRPAAARR